MFPLYKKSISNNIFSNYVQARGGHVLYNPQTFPLNNLAGSGCSLPSLSRSAAAAGLPSRCPRPLMPSLHPSNCTNLWPRMKTALAIRGHPKPHLQPIPLFTIVFHQPINNLPIKCSASTFQNYQLLINLTQHVPIHHLTQYVPIHHFIIITPHHQNFIPLPLSYSISPKTHPVITFQRNLRNQLL